MYHRLMRIRWQSYHLIISKPICSSINQSFIISKFFTISRLNEIKFSKYAKKINLTGIRTDTNKSNVTAYGNYKSKTIYLTKFNSLIKYTIYLNLMKLKISARTTNNGDSQLKLSFGPIILVLRTIRDYDIKNRLAPW